MSEHEHVGGRLHYASGTIMPAPQPNSPVALPPCIPPLSPLHAALRDVTIFDLWRHFRLSGTPGKSCHSPFRRDDHPSFSVSDDGKLFNDFAAAAGGRFDNYRVTD